MSAEEDRRDAPEKGVAVIEGDAVVDFTTLVYSQNVTKHGAPAGYGCHVARAVFDLKASGGETAVARVDR